MIALKKYIIIVLFLFFASAVNAQTNGCYVAATSKMYYQTPTGGNSTTYFEGGGFYVSQANCTYDYASIVTGPTATSCYAIYDGSGGRTSSSNYSIAGKKATFNVVICPIDSYTLLLMALMASIGYFFLRRMVLNPTEKLLIFNKPL